MPRNYQRKAPHRTVVTDDQLKAARLLILKGTSIRKAANKVGLKESTLRHRLKAGKTAGSLGRFSTTFTKAQEDEIYQYLKRSDDIYLTMESIQKIVYEYAESNKIPHRFNTSTKLAGRDWVYGFLKRYSELRLGQPTPTSIDRGMSFNQGVPTKSFKQDIKTKAASDMDEEDPDTDEKDPDTDEEPEILNIKYEVDEDSVADQLQENPLGPQTESHQLSASASHHHQQSVCPKPSTNTQPPRKRRRSTSPLTSTAGENLQYVNERLLAIEEARIETDRELARAMNRQASALEELVGVVKHFVDIYVRDHNPDLNASNNKNI